MCTSGVPLLSSTEAQILHESKSRFSNIVGVNHEPENLSTAGHEASRTGSMKFLMNGCLLLATADGSTVEIIEEIGAENMFLFGAKLDEVPILRERGPNRKVNLQFARVVR
ncbi:uncharacterized protein LOC133788541 [Humulus lupulus]|uniref:uncharacterized protein LOC133788541 n=1 Tax=Humulus lupulus TaxID=3486 RepID=UPI002B404DF9|nr:uncharacterized protein LOC133788541 [Humulus lupulus]